MLGDASNARRHRDQLLAREVVESFFAEVMALADKKGLLSKEHFSVDGTLDPILVEVRRKTQTATSAIDKRVTEGG
ncbi:protein of unknown function [Georgfuchsia toluolica]|uniref:Transposase n=1 Tax=Georgfuchsia toluolica TaxID=424218 RepID=A0A916J516_9PROT|nr:protein of unknown function [Georgfuchsia toluolica]